MTTKQYLQLQDIYAENCDASGNITTVYPALGLGVRGNYEIAILNASALQTEGVDSWMFAIGQDFDADTHILYENTNVSYAVNGTSGLFTVSGMQGTRTDDMVEWIGDQETPTVVGELIGMGDDHDKNKPVSLVQWRMFMRNRVDWDSEDEPSVVPNYATTDDLENLIYKKRTIPDTEFTLTEEDGDSYKEVAYQELPDFGYFIIPSGLSATKVENEDAYMLNGMYGECGEYNTAVKTYFEFPVKLERKESQQENVAEYSASGKACILTIDGVEARYTSTFNFDLQGLEDDTEIYGASVPQWRLTVGKPSEILRYYAPRKTEVNNLLIPVSGGEFTGDIHRNEFNEDFSYTITDCPFRLIANDGGLQSIYVFRRDSTVYYNGFDLVLNGLFRQAGSYYTEYQAPITLSRIPNTNDFEFYFNLDGGISIWQKLLFHQDGDDYLLSFWYAEDPERIWYLADSYTNNPIRLVGFNPFKPNRYTTVSGEVFENGIFSNEQIGTKSYYTTDHLEGNLETYGYETSARSGAFAYTWGFTVPSAIDVQMNEDSVLLKSAKDYFTRSRRGNRPPSTIAHYNDVKLKYNNGIYTASAICDYHNDPITWFYQLELGENGARMDVYYTHNNGTSALGPWTGTTELVTVPEYRPYLTHSEFSYEDEVQSLTTDSGNLTIYDNPWKNPDSLRATVKLPGNRVWEGNIPKVAGGTYMLNAFQYEGLVVYRLGVAVGNSSSYVIAYDGGGEGGEWDIPQEFGTHRFIPTSGGTFGGTISASDGTPYATSGYYEGLIQSRIDNPDYAGDNLAMTVELNTHLGDFSPFAGSDTILEMEYGPFNESTLGTIATRELKVTNSEVSANWHINEFNWLHAPVTICEPGSSHDYYITARLNVTSTDPFQLMNPSLWTLDCWKID